MKSTAYLPVLAVALAACGGGGGGGNLPPPPPPQNIEVPLDETNVVDAAVVSAGLFEGTLQLTELAAFTIQKVAARGEGQFSENCSNGGVSDYVFTDTDQDGTPTPRDSIRATFNDCELRALNAVASGDFVITLGTSNIPSSREHRAYAGQIDATGLTIDTQTTASVTIADSFSFEVEDGLLAQSRRAFGDLRLMFTDGGTTLTEGLENFDFVKSTSFETARIDLSAAGTIDSDILGGQIEYDEATGLSSFLNTYPEQGRFGFEGANGSRGALVSNFVSQSAMATVALDATGNGTFTDVAENFWSEFVEGYLWWYEPGSVGGYQAATFNSNAFRVIHLTPSSDRIVDVNPALRIQFSRPVDPASVPSAIRLQRQFQEPPFREEFLLDIDLRGAALVLRPMEQLQHGFRYFYPVDGFNAEDGQGNSDFVFGSGFITDDNLQAVATASARLGVTGDTITLDGSMSTSEDGGIRSYAWTQVSGPEGQIDDADQPIASFTIPDVNVSELIELQLEITNQDGEFNRSAVTLSSFSSVADIRYVRFDGDSNDYISGGMERFLTSANGTFGVERNFDNGISVQHDTPQPAFERWGFDFAAPGDAELAVGAYDDATRYPFQDPAEPGLDVSGDGRGCNQLTGRFDILDVAYDTNGDVLVAAIDFEQHCEGGTAKLSGSLRIGSAIAEP